ncbi:MAG: homoserine kinase [Acidobacteriaceae bacterium]
MKTVYLRLPATSANLGPGFDAMALALGLFLEIDAVPASRFSIEATGRNAGVCADLTQNLLIQTFESVLVAEKKPVSPLKIHMRNGIPIGMGCGSSAATRLAGVALASAFGGLDWDVAQIVEYAARLEGHPDNVAACWHGGLSVVAGGERMSILSIPPPAGWGALVVFPEVPLSTTKARSALPMAYPRQDVVSNLQAASLLTAAFALGRADLMQIATRDRLHQPYRAHLCPLLPALLPLAGSQGVLSVTLSGAGPSVLLLTHQPADEAIKQAIRERAEGLCLVDILAAELCREGAVMHCND